MMDLQLIEIYQNCINKSGSNKSFIPDLKYYKKLFQTVDVVISPLGTMAIESMIIGKPVILLTFPDEKHEFSINIIQNYDHHECWTKFKTPIKCDNFSTIILLIERAISNGQDQQYVSLLKEEVKYVVHNDQRTYAMRLKELIETI